MAQHVVPAADEQNKSDNELRSMSFLHVTVQYIVTMQLFFLPSVDPNWHQQKLLVLW